MAMNRLRPSRWYYALAVLLLVAGGAVFAWMVFAGLSRMNDGLQQVVVPGQAELRLDTPGRYTIYHEYRTVGGNKVYGSDQPLPPLTVTVVSRQTGAEVAVKPATVNEHYSLGSRSGRSIMAFTVEQPGTYVLAARYVDGASGPEVVFAVGPGFAGGLVGTILGGMAVLFGSLLASGTLAGVTFWKRYRAKQSI